MCRQSAMPCLTKSPVPEQRSLPDLAARLTALPDPRDRRGRRHHLVSILLTACAAVLTGSKSYAVIGQWARSAPQHTLARLGARTTTHPAALGKIAWSQWGIEAVHHVWDVTFSEDASKIRTGPGPANMATFRNLAINILRTEGYTSIAAGLREISYEPFTRPLDLLKLP
ncbi:transposase family protein [Streptomyces noursei]|uniref:transposase family protein n=1 Tax=Streptomyces noursei TaxID=1971 RepID=UPI00081C8229|nr:DDE_Tnp_1-associated [Streptomyces noursei ATCC 11455]MCZ0991876.1 transposase family protein [Streptomyces noursei]